MRLQLGCGKRYLPDAVNVDRFDRTVADLVADARRLPFRDRAFEAVVADQLLEHLGYGGAVYALAEWHRVLRPGGELALETPEPEASFARFLGARGPAEKDRALGWIFGDEAPGFAHTFLYPRDLLEPMVERAGFESLEWGEPQTHVTEPGQRLVGRAADSAVARALAAVRSRMARVVLALPDPSEVAELENGLVEHLLASAGSVASDRHLGDALVVWSRATLWWVSELERGRAAPLDLWRDWSRVVREMARFELSGRLAALVEPRSESGPLGGHLHEELTSLGLAVVARHRASGRPAESCWEELVGAPPPAPCGPAFTASGLQHLAERVHARAVRSWIRGERAAARAGLLRVCRIGVGQLYAWWNLGRLAALEGAHDEALAFLETALSLSGELEEGAVRCDVGGCLLALGRADEAAALLADERAGSRGRALLGGAPLELAPLSIGELPRG